MQPLPSRRRLRRHADTPPRYLVHSLPCGIHYEAYSPRSRHSRAGSTLFSLTHTTHTRIHPQKMLKSRSKTRPNKVESWKELAWNGRTGRERAMDLGSYTRTLHFRERREPGSRERLGRSTTLGRLLDVHHQRDTVRTLADRGWQDLLRVQEPSTSATTLTRSSLPLLAARVEHADMPCWATGGVRLPRFAVQPQAGGRWVSESMAQFSTAQFPRAVSAHALRSPMHQAPPLASLW